jgi:DNA-binding transcriptional regulator GbsR (MarR family)
MSIATAQARVTATYTPQTQTKQQLIEGFVVRKKIFLRLFKVIKEAKMEVPEQHYLIFGQQGMGKTSLLLRLAYAVEDDTQLNNWLIPLVFKEEEYSIRRLFNFWERTLELLSQRLPGIQFTETHRKKLSALHKDDDSYERALFNMLGDELKHCSKKIILFIDNFGDLTRRLTHAEAHRLRKILKSSSDIRLFAASTKIPEAFFQYDHPFYEFFKIEELQALNEKEAGDLLLNLARRHNQEIVPKIMALYPSRVETLRRMSGGEVRTLSMLFEVMSEDDNNTDAFQYLKIVLDRATPQFKYRMDDLSSQQQAIVEAIALNWDALSVREIVERTRLESKIISAQLQYLEKSGLIEKRPTHTKNHLYMIADRFFNLWFLLRSGRSNDENSIHWLVRFYENWCDPQKAQFWTEFSTKFVKKGEENLSIITKSFKEKNILAKDPTEIIGVFLFLLSRNEAQWLLEYFRYKMGETAHLKDRFKPIYYAVLKKLDHPDYLRMGDELRQTVDEILNAAQHLAFPSPVPHTPTNPPTAAE